MKATCCEMRQRMYFTTATLKQQNARPGIMNTGDEVVAVESFAAYRLVAFCLSRWSNLS